MKIPKKHILFFLLISVVVLAFRFYGIDHKPIHHDESINGWFVANMWKNGFFNYDPTNYHGPLLFYIFQWAEALFGDKLTTYRGVTAFFSALTVLFFVGKSLQLGLAKGLGFLIAAVLLLLSPGAQFFGQSGIHESMFVFSLLLMLWGWTGPRGEIWGFALGLAMAFALKETVSVFLISAAVAAFVVWLFNRDLHRVVLARVKEEGFQPWIFVVAFLAVFFTGFFQDSDGILNFFKAYLPWLKTGVGGGGHDKPFRYWLDFLWQYERGTLLMLLVPILAWRQVSWSTRFFTILGVVHFAIYGLIPYKTPWCWLSLQLPIFWAGALALQDLLGRFKWPLKSSAALAMILIAFSNIGLIQELSWNKRVNLEHPYVYVQTQYGFWDVMEQVTAHSSELQNEVLFIATEEHWPTPWVFRKFKHLQWGTPKSEVNAQHGILFFDVSEKDRLDALLSSTHDSKVFATRSHRQDAVMYFRKDLKGFFP